MNPLALLRRLLQGTRSPVQPPPRAYDLLAATYDDSADNMLIALDEGLFAGLLRSVPVSNTTVLDFGCGTGRYWPGLMAQAPARLIGYDASEGMLRLLRAKFPGAEVYRTEGSALPQIGSASVDLIVSTLTIHYLQQLEGYFREWDRVLRPGGIVIITGYHPEALKGSAAIRFPHGSSTISVQHNSYSLREILDLALHHGWQCATCSELPVDESVKRFYEQKKALRAYESAKGTPIIYGLRFIKAPGSAGKPGE